MEGEALNEIVTKVDITLSGIENSTFYSPDSISYRFIMIIKDTILGQKMIEKVATNLIKETISKEWQNSKAVMIPKPMKNHEKTKGWRPINLMNCIGKLEEKVVPDIL